MRSAISRKEEDSMELIRQRSLKDMLASVILILVRTRVYLAITLLAALVPTHIQAAEVTYTPPVPIQVTEATYPVNSVATGTVVVIVVVERDGQVSEAKVLKSVKSLDEPSVYAAKLWRFDPARLDDQPVRSKASISFVYNRGLFPPEKAK